VIPFRPVPVLALLSFAFAANGEQTRPARELAVPSAGWIRAALDVEARALLPPDGRLVVLGADGTAVPSFPLLPRRGQVPLALVGSEETPDGWRLLFDAGVTPILHARFEATPTREATAAVALEGSDDGTRWMPLARGTLARLGENAGLARTAVEYAATSNRFLRLSWPRSGGFPALDHVAVVALEAPAGPGTAATVTPDGADGGWRISLPTAGLSAARITLAGTGLAGTPLRLLAARDGRWYPLASIESCPLDECVVELPRAPLPSAALRAAADPARGARIDSATVSLEPEWVLFEAPSAGRFLLASGPGGEGASRDPGPIEGPVTEIPLGGPAHAPLPPLRPDALELAPAGRLPRGWVSWPVRADGIRAGEVARLEVTDALLDQPGVRDDGLRPMVGQQVVPFSTRILPEPEAGESAAAVAGRATLELRRGPAAVVQLEAAAPGSACSGTLEATWVRERRAGVEERRLAGTGTWSAGESGTGPCLALIDVSVPELVTRLEVAARGSGTAPERVRAWRARRELRFAWPGLGGADAGGAGEVRLASGFDPLLESAPRVISVRRQLDSRPAREVRVDLEATAAEIGATVRRTRLALWAALLVAAIVLVVVLGRGLTRGPPRGDFPGPGT